MFSINHKALAKCALLVVALAFSTGRALAQDAQDLPEAGQGGIFADLLQCHAVTIATRLRMTEDGWSGIVDDMVSKGAQGTDDEFDRVVKYLAAHFGPNNPGGSAKSSSLQSGQQKQGNRKSHFSDSRIDGRGLASDRSLPRDRGRIRGLADLEKVPHIDLKKLAAEKDSHRVFEIEGR